MSKFKFDTNSVLGLVEAVEMETMYFHIAHSIFWGENFVSHSEGPTEQLGMNLKGLMSAG